MIFKFFPKKSTKSVFFCTFFLAESTRGAVCFHPVPSDMFERPDSTGSY
jgi:hypothetical protein